MCTNGTSEVLSGGLSMSPTYISNLFMLQFYKVGIRPSEFTLTGPHKLTEKFLANQNLYGVSSIDMS